MLGTPPGGGIMLGTPPGGMLPGGAIMPGTAGMLPRGVMLGAPGGMPVGGWELGSMATMLLPSSIFAVTPLAPTFFDTTTTTSLLPNLENLNRQVTMALSEAPGLACSKLYPA